MTSLHEKHGPGAVKALQGIMHANAPDLPERFLTRPNARGNGKLVTDTSTGNEVEVGLCDWHGFVTAIKFTL